MKWTVILAVLLLSAACAMEPGSWRWLHPDPQYAAKNLWRDIDDCEDFANRVEDRGPFGLSSNARDYGGWGDFQFELCMERRGWKMTYVPSGQPKR